MALPSGRVLRLSEEMTRSGLGHGEHRLEVPSERKREHVFDLEPNHTHDEVYSAFSKSQKAIIILLVSAAGFFSPFSAFIYFPVLESIAHDLNVSIQLMNITITVYLVVQGIAPSLFGEMSENLGRRPMYLLVFIIYTIASVALALQRSYPALLALRMVQSMGSSGTLALAYAVISDIAAPHERGGYAGIAHVGFNAAPSLGPVMGGILSDKAGWPWIFWILTIFGGTVFVSLLIFIPETCRKVVGNGSVSPKGLSKALFPYQLPNGSYTSRSHAATSRISIPSLWPCIRLIFRKNLFMLLFSNAVFYMKYSCVQASLAPLLQRIYGLSVSQVGFCYLAFGVACAVASYGVGIISNYDYQQTARSHGLSIDRKKGDDLSKFPIEKARLRTIWLYIFVSATSTLGYGWSLQARTHLAIPLILQFLVGLTVTGIFNNLNTLVVDLNPDRPATASASVSLTRCLLAAAGISVLQILFDNLGPGWTFTIVACLCYGTVPLLLLERQKGWGWRLEPGGSQSGRTLNT